MSEVRLKKVMNIIYVIFLVFVAFLTEYIVIMPKVNIEKTSSNRNISNIGNNNYSHVIITGKFFSGNVPEKVKEIYTIDENNLVVNIRVIKEFDKAEIAQEQYENMVRNESMTQVQLKGKIIVANRSIEPGLTKDRVIQNSSLYVKTGGGLISNNTLLYEIEEF